MAVEINQVPRRYLGETTETVHKRILDGINDNIDKRQGSVVYDLTRAPSIEFERVYMHLDNVLKFGFAGEDMPSEYLDLRVAELGITRKPAVNALGTLTFSGDAGTLIEKGTRVSTEGRDVIYAFTTDYGVIEPGGTVEVPAQADVGGAQGNVDPGLFVNVIGNLPGVVGVVNNIAFEGGVDVETDESLLKRYFDRTRKPITSGNIYHYEQWAREVPGVGGVRVYPIWDGPGTVKVVIIDENMSTPSQTLIDATKAHIEEFRPIGAEVTVTGASEKVINVSVSVQLRPGTGVNGVKADVEQGVAGYLSGIAFRDPVVRYTQIAAVLSGIPEIVDYADLLVNDDITNIEVGDAEIAVLGGVNVVEQV